MNMERTLVNETKVKPFALVIIEAWNSRVNEKIMELYAADYIGEDLTGNKIRSGREGVKHWMNSVFHAFPNIHYELIEFIENGDQLAFHWVARGNHHGSFLKIPASGKLVSIHGMSIMKIEKEKIKEGKLMWDLAAVLRQMGLLPQMP